MTRKLLFGALLGLAGSTQVIAQSGNHVFTGSEAVNFGSIDLPTGGGTWSTARTATPGYFSAVQGATYTNATDAANVNGYVKKYGNEAFTFPVGSGTDLRTLSIVANAAAATTDAIAVAWIAGDPSGNLDPTSTGAAGGAHSIGSFTPVAGSLYAISDAGQWDWQDLNNTYAGKAVTVSIPDMSGFASTASNLRLVGWNGTEWVLLGTSGASALAENSTLTGTMIAGISAIGIGSTQWPLPVNVVNFGGKAQDCDALITWDALNETGIRQYVIQSSNDGVEYRDVATVSATNNGTASSYSQVVAQANSKVYYRVRIEEENGRTAYTISVPVITGCGAGVEGIQIYPNPSSVSHTGFNVELTTAYEGKAEIVMTNVLGQRIVAEPVQVNKGLNTYTVTTNYLAAGNYYVQVVAGNKAISEVVKVVKQ